MFKQPEPLLSDDAFALLDYLYQEGFLNARVAKGGSPEDYDHLSPLKHPKLVSKINLNNLQTVTWEVHPAYRDFLIDEQQGAFGRQYR